MPDERFFKARESLNLNMEDHEAAQVIGLSKELIRLGQYDEALKSLEAALSSAPGNADLHYNVGRVYCQKKNWDRAAFHIQRAIAIAPDVAQYYLVAAECAARRKDMEAALFHIEMAKRIDPALFKGWALWALIYFRIFAGIEKMGCLMGWATLATLWACLFSATNLHWWFLAASLPFLLVSGWNFRKHRYRRAVWALALYVLWAVPAYLIVKGLLS